MNRAVLIPLAAIAGLVPAAQGSIVWTSGQVVHYPAAPLSAMPFSLRIGSAVAWDERQSVGVSGMVDLSTNPSSSTAPVNAPLSRVVDSHLVHFDHGLPVTASGRVRFSGRILGVIGTESWLDATDAQAGSPGTAYPTGNLFRGADTWWFTQYAISGKELTFYLAPRLECDQLRVFTDAVPSPGSIAIAGVGGLLALRRRRPAP